MPVDKGRYKKGMFLIGPDHPCLGIVKLIVTTVLISAATTAIGYRSQVVVIGEVSPCREPWDEPVDGKILFRALSECIRCYVVLTVAQANAPPTSSRRFGARP